jgi:tRNA threonylcarbamoyladenosine biosynthesis protein TsaB
MRVLAIDTATRRGSVALAGPSGTLAERSAEVPAGHLEWLVPAIGDTLAGARLKPDDVDGIVVSIGPGGFTGLRVGVATAVLWARARNTPMLGISTLEIVASGVRHRGLVLAALDARRGELAAAVFRSTETGPVKPLERLTPDLLITVDALPAHIGNRDEPLLVAGDAMPKYGDTLLAALGSRAAAAPEDAWWPRASIAAALGRPRLLAGERHDPVGLVPHYVQRSVAREFRAPAP